jgi:hypothetical protein
MSALIYVVLDTRRRVTLWANESMDKAANRVALYAKLNNRDASDFEIHAMVVHADGHLSPRERR